tara:strand:- start:9497 stop:9838 length:342 start_codon:yes stop_codon:yes gene_type:complete
MSNMEHKIAELLVETLVSKHLVSVFDGEETTVHKSRDKREVLDALESTDSDTLEVYSLDGKNIGYFWLIWGNGPDLISDYGVNRGGGSASDYLANDEVFNGIMLLVEKKMGIL